MGNEIIKLAPDVDFVLKLPNSISEKLASAAIVAVTGVATALFQQGISIISAGARVIEEQKIILSLYQERGKYLREYIIPTIALYDSIQIARNYIESSKWDDDLRLKASQDLEKILEKYRVK